MATIAENLNRIQSAKTDIRTAIEAKGVTVPSSATIDTYDTYVSQISGGMPMPSKLSSASFNDYGVITSAEIKSGVTSIGDMAFYNVLSLQSITIPDTVTSIGHSSFYNCGNISNITIPDSVTTIGEQAFFYCGFSNITIPSGVTSIGSNAFQGCRITSIVIPSGVTTINYYTFGECTSLSSVIIPNSVTSIGGNAFSSCYSLTSITIPSSVTSIGEYAFAYGYSFTGITCMATTPPTLGSGAFDDTNDCPIYVPASSLSTYQSAWSDYASRIQAIPGSYKWLATYSGGTTSTAACDSTSAITLGEINNTDLVSVEIGECVTSIGYGAFDDYTSITSCTIGSGVTSIAGTAFRDCRRLTSIDIPDSVASIGGSAFNGCTGLTSCTIGSGITSIGIGSFSNCTSLTSITIKATTPPTLNSGAFYGSTCPIYVPAASLTAYQASEDWEDYRTRLQAIS